MRFSDLKDTAVLTAFTLFQLLWRNTRNPLIRTPDHRHLDGDRRKLLSPLAAATALSDIVFGNRHVLDALNSCPRQQHQLTRVAVLGDTIRVNLFRLEIFPNGPLTPPFNPSWITEGIVDFLITPLNECIENPLNQYLHLSRPTYDGRSYDVYEPYASLVIPLEAAEIKRLETFMSSK